MQDRIKKIRELNKKRTQGGWESEKICPKYKWYVQTDDWPMKGSEIICITDNDKLEDAEFIAAAPEMANIIEHLQALNEWHDISTVPDSLKDGRHLLLWNDFVGVFVGFYGDKGWTNWFMGSGDHHPMPTYYKILDKPCL